MQKQKNKLKKNIKIVASLLIGLSILITLTSFYVPAENLQIRLYAHLKINTLQLNVVSGSYKILADGNSIADSGLESIIKLTLKGDSIQLTQNDKIIGNFIYIKFVGTQNEQIKIKLIIKKII
jgi:hypothetical protein